MRKALVAASLVALLVALYAAAGYWLAPRFLREALVERASALGLSLELAEARTDPFRLTVTLEGVRVLADGRELARAQGLMVDLAWASLWGDAWVVQEAALREPWAHVVMGPQGRLNWPIAHDGGGRQPALDIRRLSVRDGVILLADRSRAAPVEVQFEAVDLRAEGLSTRQGARAQYAASARLAQGGVLSSHGSLGLDPLSAEGRVSIAAAPLGMMWSLAAPASEAGSGQVQGSAQYSYDGEALVLNDVALEGSGVAHSGIELSRVQLAAARIVLPSNDGFEVSATARFAPAGDVSASGSIALRPFAAVLRLELAGVPLAQANRWLPQDATLTIASGALSASGQARLRPDDARFEGSVRVSDARLEERGSRELLLAWKELATTDAALSFIPFSAELGEVVARAPSGRLVIEEGGQMNFAGAAPKGGARQPVTQPGRVAVRRLRIEQGTLDFADRSLENDFAVTVRELSGSVTGFGTGTGNPARVQLSGRVGEYGAARIRGSIDLDEPKSLTSIRATLRNLDLAALTPYVVKFAGYRVESGRVTAELRYRVRDGRLVGRNDLAFEELRLGEKVRRAGARDLPLELAVALLADAQGRINLDIPVSGDLNDPQFDFGGLVARALGNVVGKIVSAPFRVLAGVFGKGGGEDMNRVAFPPGSVALAPPEEETVARVARALAERPRLNVTVAGGYDPQADAAALRRDAARREIARRAGAASEGPLDFGEPKVLQAAERLYLERVGNRLQLLALREAEPAYGRALLERLAAARPVDPQSVQTLAQARAETVRAELLAHGVEPSRVRLEAPATREEGKDGVPTVLALDAERSAAAGATARAKSGSEPE